MKQVAERPAPTPDSPQMSYEYFHRYAICREHVDGKRVIDLACGVGYGSALLAQRAAAVVGVDTDSQAIRSAQKHHQSANIEFLVGDCLDLPFDDASFDVIIANDIIETVGNRTKLLNELRRVMRPGGTLLASIQNKPVSERLRARDRSAGTEMDVAEFTRLLNRNFDHVLVTGLRMGLMSVAFRITRSDERSNLPSALTYVGDLRDTNAPEISADELWLHEPEYVLAVCSNEAVSHALPGPSLFVSRDHDLWLEHRKLTETSTDQHNDPANLRDQLGQARADLESERRALETLRSDFRRLDDRFSDLRKAADTSADALALYEANVARTNADQYAIPSRLLSRMTGSAVANDGESLVEALFALNQTLTEQRAQIADGQRVQTQLADAASKYESLAAEKSDYQDRLRTLSDALERVQRDSAAFQAQLDVANREKSLAQAAHAQATDAKQRSAAALLVTTEERDRAVSEAAQLRSTRDTLSSQLAAQRDALARAEAALVEAVEARRRSKAKLAAKIEECDRVLRDVARLQSDHDALAEAAHQAAAQKSAAELSRVAALETQRRTEEELAAAAALRDQALLDAERLRSERDVLADEAASAREMAARIEADHARAIEAQRASEAAVLARTEERDRALSDTARDRSARDKLAADLAALRATVDNSPTVVSPTTAPRVVDSSVTRAAASQAQQLERFIKVHQAVSGQLERAARDVAGRVAPARDPSTQPGKLKRWVRNANPYIAPFRTVLFDAGWVALQAPSVGRISLARYLRSPNLWALDPHPVFAASTYLDAYPSVAAAGVCPLTDYRTHGWREGRNPHPYFANDWYLAQNPDVLSSGSISPLEHYLEHGWREGRWPNPLFDPRAYLDRYPDVAAARVEPLTHFLSNGRSEGREIPSGTINPAWNSLVPEDATNRNLLDFMLLEKPLRQADEIDASPVASAPAQPNWPPERLNDYWLPQRLRDFIISGHGEEPVALYSYLCSVMSAYQAEPEEFPASPQCSEIVDRVRMLSAARAADLVGAPDASIIIPVYNNVIDTLLCIASVFESPTERSYEIIVADDGSNDATPQIITSLGGVVRYIRQPRNYGFIGNCNEAAKQADGATLIFLNNDTLVMPGWLDPLLATFVLHDNVGLSGSKLISWDGTLQEAGGIYWKDGSAWNFGRGADARAPEFSYLKDVDYISGAAIAVPAELWREMNGFDVIYSPAYCEDSDIAFRLRAAGYRTILNPQSEVLHHEGRSHGRDLTSGIKAYQTRNQQIFFDRWQETLERDHFPNAENVLVARDRSRYRKHVLVIDHYVPQWDQDAGSRSTFMCIQAFLALGYSVTFWPDNLWRDPQYTPRLQELGVEVIFGSEYRDGFKDFIQSRSDLYDAAFVNRPHIAPNYLDALRNNTRARIIYYGHDLHFRRMAAAQASGEFVADADIEAMRKQELDVCRKADVVMYPDPTEVRIVKESIGGKGVFAALPVFAFENEILTRGLTLIDGIKAKTDHKLLFVGGFNHTPNRDGIQWFVDSVLPELERRLGSVHLTIVGSKPPVSITSLAGPTISVAGFVSDSVLAAYYEEASVIIAPLRYGGGVKGKVVEAMAMGVPLVTTPIGAQGFEEAGEIFFSATNADEFVTEVETALLDRDEAWRRAQRAHAFVTEHYSAGVLEDIFRTLVEQR